MLLLVPTLLFIGGAVLETEFEVWAPVPVQYCYAIHHQVATGQVEVFFHCARFGGGGVRFSISGVTKA